MLTMLFMHSSTGLAIWAGIVVLCRFLAGADGARSPSFAQRRLPGRTPTRGCGWAIGSVKAAGRGGG